MPQVRIGWIVLKRHCITLIFSAGRVGALRHGLEARSTLAGLKALRELDVAKSSVVDDFVESHGICLNLLLRQQLRDLNTGIRMSSEVTLSDLTRHDRAEMIWALKRVPSIADVLGTPSSYA